MAVSLTEQQEKLVVYLQNSLGVKLNEGQLKLALPSDKSKMCSAVPGSGKTTALGIAVTLEEVIKGIPPKFIHVMTFTNKATIEFKHRHANIMNKLRAMSFVNISTIHSMCKKYVEMFHKKMGIMEVKIMDEKESFDFLKRIIVNVLGLKDNQVPTSMVTDIESCISFLNNRLLFTQEEVTKTYQFIRLKMDYGNFKMIRDIYRKSQRNNGMLSFDETMVLFYDMLREHEDIRNGVQSQIQSLFVDEFQDTTRLQFEIIKMLKAPTTSITVVGDQDQSIYRWRGASDVYQDFMLEYPDYEHVTLDINYRCPDFVVTASNALIRNNTKRLDVKAKGTGKQGKLTVISTTSNQVASLEISKMIIEDYERSGRDNNILMDKLVLYRNHSQGMFLVYELASRKIPVNTQGVLLPHKDKIVRDILGICHFLENPRDSRLASDNMYKISSQINRPKTKDKCPFFNSDDKTHFVHVEVNVKDRQTYENELRALNGICNMIKDREPARKIFSAILPLYMGAYYARYNMANLLGKTDEDVRAIERFLLTGLDASYNLDQFQYVLNQVEQFLNESNKDNVGVKIYSIHAAKGLEAKQVYLLDMNGKSQPNRSTLDALKEERAYEAMEEHIIEERSLAFVAITRAKEELYVTYNREDPSPFNWESGLNDEFRAKKNMISLEKLGIRTKPSLTENNQSQQYTQQNNNRVETRGNQDMLDERARELSFMLSTPKVTREQTMNEIAKISSVLGETADRLTKRQVESKPNNLGNFVGR